MSKATSVLTPGEPVTLPPAGNISFEIEQGQRFKMTQPQGEQVADLISFNRDDPRELLTSYLMLRERPELGRSIRTEGRATAKRFAWPRILEGYESVWETAFALTS